MKTSKKAKVTKKATTTKKQVTVKKTKAVKTPKNLKVSKKLTPKQISDMAVDSLVISMNQQFQKIETQDEANLIEYITFTTLGDKILGHFGKKVFNQYVKDIMEDFKDSKK
ncbi:MAG: hypothetical protein H7281_17000 [Bacteriovorax sp.]|nr:hypothetical protein [Bacteriovorax sp.]